MYLQEDDEATGIVQRVHFAWANELPPDSNQIQELGKVQTADRDGKGSIDYTDF